MAMPIRGMPPVPSERGGRGARRTVHIAAGLGLGALVVIAGVLASDLSVLSRPTASLAGTLAIAPGREFAADSVVYRRLAPDAAIDPHSSLWVADLQRQANAVPAASVNIRRFAPPLYVVPADQPTVRVAAARAAEPEWRSPDLQRLWEAVPLPTDFRPADGTDKEAIVYQPATGRYWEFWLTEKTGRDVHDSAGRTVPEWRAAWGGRIDDLAANPGYFVTGADGITYGTAATGLVLLGGLITIADQRRGTIDHAVHFAIPHSRERSVWAFPAQRSDGQDPSDTAIPQGTTFRLPADLDLDALDMDPYARMIARAVQAHGMILRDTAGSVVFYAENPAAQFAVDPYTGPGGILKCPNGQPDWRCAPTSSARLRGFPWDRLQALKVTLNRPANDAAVSTAITP
jgi:hypothetical protein